MSAHGAEEVQKQVRTYIVVFAALAGLTVITVAISYLHLPTPQAVALALVVATAKASLVALFFMHLIDEQRAIYWLLILTGTFFVALAYLPLTWDLTVIAQPSLWNTLPIEGSAKQAAETRLGAHGAHGGGHEAGAEHH